MTTATASCESLRMPRSWNDTAPASDKKAAAAPQTATLSPMRSAVVAKTSHKFSSSSSPRKVSRTCGEFRLLSPTITRTTGVSGGNSSEAEKHRAKPRLTTSLATSGMPLQTLSETRLSMVLAMTTTMMTGMMITR